jgi:hypothetical protein
MGLIVNKFVFSMFFILQKYPHSLALIIVCNACYLNLPEYS